jgi:creatinine amidohydrolase
LKKTFWDMTTVELEEAIKQNPVIILPVGQVEEHGPHLPVGCDSFIADKIAKSVAEKSPENLPIITMPVIWTGYSPKLMSKWKGTMRVRTRVVLDLVHDILASLVEMGFKRIVVIDGHGQHRGILETAIREISDEFGVFCALTSPFVFSSEQFSKIRKTKMGGVAHACEWETSLMLYFGSDVDLSKVSDIDQMNYKSDFYEADGFGKKMVYLSTWGIHESKTGCLGDPTKATAETGKLIFDYTVGKYIDFCREYRNIKMVNEK